ncbi:MAG: polymer-forming cytoskeletal protein, partial [bacterium]
MFGRRKAPRLPGRIDTLLGRGTTFRGELEFTGGLHIDGVHSGDVRGVEGAAPSALWVGEAGQVKGNINVAIAVINGEVVGDVRAAQRVVLGAKARVTGDVTYG